jgi:tetratricopeptide (TPR) repeat protein
MKIVRRFFNSLAKLCLSYCIFSSCSFSVSVEKKLFLAQQHIQKQEFKKAVSLFKSVLKMPNIEEKLMAKIYYQLGEISLVHDLDSNKAIHYLTKSQIYDQNPMWLVKVEEKIAEIAYFYRKDYVSSASSYEKLSQFQPRLEKAPDYEWLHAMSLFKIPEYVSAEQQLLKISKMRNQFSSQSLFYLGMIYLGQKNYPKAIFFWNEAIQLDLRKDLQIEAKFLMANAYESMEKLRNAYNIYQSLLNEYPNPDVIKKRLDAIYQRRVNVRR